MTKKPRKISSAAATGSVGTSDDERLQEGAGALPSPAPAPDPSGENGPDGTNTTASESGDAAGTASAGTVKPHGKDGPSTPVTVTDATNGQPTPDAEASASGANDSDASQGAADGGAGNPAGSAGAPSKRIFLATSAYRHGGRRHLGGPQALTAEVHADLYEAGVVTVTWDDGVRMEG